MAEGLSDAAAAADADGGNDDDVPLYSAALQWPPLYH
jgi:hypothetical protein